MGMRAYRGVFRPLDRYGRAVRSPWPDRAPACGAQRMTASLPDGDGEVQIETERLVMRPPRAGDFTSYFEMCADAETFRFSERGPMSCDEAWSRLLRHAGHWSLLGHGLFTLVDKESGRFAGEAGLGDFRRALGAEFDNSPEAGWAIAPWARGRGLATEAMVAALAWMESQFGRVRSVCMIHADNAPSIRVAAKLGYAAYDERLYRGFRALMFERPRARTN